MISFLSFEKEQEVSLLSDAENLSALLQEAARQCDKPNNLPEAGEHIIEEFKLSESGFLDEQVKCFLAQPNRQLHQPIKFRLTKLRTTDSRWIHLFVRISDHATS